MPTIVPQVRTVSDLSAGTAAEHLVCAELLMRGYNAFMTDQNCAYDIAVDIDGYLIRLQVKSTRKQKAIPQRAQHIPAYLFHVRRAGKGGIRNYGNDEFDMLALVALDIQKTAYMAPSHTLQTIHIRPPGAIGGKQFSQYSFSAAIEALASRRELDIGMTA